MIECEIGGQFVDKFEVFSMDNSDDRGLQTKIINFCYVIADFVLNCNALTRLIKTKAWRNY